MQEGLGAVRESSGPTHLLASLRGRRTIAVPASLLSEVDGTYGRLGSHIAERATRRRCLSRARSTLSSGRPPVTMPNSVRKC